MSDSGGGDAEPARDADQPGKAATTSIGLALRLLEALAAGSARRGTTELARALGINKWRIHRHLHALCAEGYAIQDPETGKFELGSRFYLLAGAAPRRFGFAHVVRPIIQTLQRRTGHSVTVTGIEEDGVVIIEIEPGGGALQIGLRLGTRLPFHVSAHGKAALAFGSPALREKIMSAPLRPWTARTITDRDALRREIEVTRRRGWASAPGKSYEGVNTIAAPIVSAAGTLHGTVGIVNTTEALTREPPAEQIAALLEAAEAISHRTVD